MEDAHSHAFVLVAIGVLFLGGLALDAFGRIVHVPRVTLLMLLGALLGPPILDVLPDAIADGNPIYTDLALTMVAFLLGSSLSRATLAAHGREILLMSIIVVLMSITLVAGGLYLLGVPLPIALLLGGISAATAPAATHDVIRQSGKTGKFVTNLTGIVAIDDAWGLLAFSVLLTLAALLLGNGADGGAVFHAFYEAGGGIVLGVAIGLPAAFLTGRLKPGEPSLVEAIGVVMLCTGLSLYFEVSFLLTGMVCGAVIVNFARHHERPFHEIERIEWPFLLLFFVMAGASLHVEALMALGVAGVGYCVLRFGARLVGGWLGGKASGLSAGEGVLMGMALMPQAGVAIGMALVASDHFPQYRETLVTITIASTIFFEIVGPLMTQYALKKSD
jgi:Kef-type K+ transport system membrane component KefB